MANTKNCVMKECSKCKNQTRGTWRYKTDFYCHRCYKKNFKIINMAIPFSFQKAMNKIYEIRGYLHKNGSINANCTFPQILIGHKVKLVLVE